MKTWALDIRVAKMPYQMPPFGKHYLEVLALVYPAASSHVYQIFFSFVFFLTLPPNRERELIFLLIYTLTHIKLRIRKIVIFSLECLLQVYVLID